MSNLDSLFKDAPVQLVTTTTVAPSLEDDQTIEPVAGFSECAIPISEVRPTRYDPISGLVAEGVVTDPLSGSELAVRIEGGRVFYVL